MASLYCYSVICGMSYLFTPLVLVGSLVGIACLDVYEA